MTDFTIVGVLVTISDTIVYYKQCANITGTIAQNINNEDQKQEECRVVPQNEEHEPATEAFALLNIINHRLATDESIDKSFSYITNISMQSTDSNDIIYKLCSKTEGTLTISILVKYLISNNFQVHQLENEITPILCSIHYQIHKFFTSSKQIPIYILCIRCHSLIQKELISYKTKRCCCNGKTPTISVQDMNRIQLEIELYNKQTAHWTDPLAIELANLTKTDIAESKNTTQQISTTTVSNWGGGHIIVYSITSRNTFEDAQLKYENICRTIDNEKEPPAILLVGNKCDMEHERQVSIKEGEQLAQKWNVPFMETSAKIKINHIHCFQEMVREIIRKVFEDPTDAIMMYENGGMPEFRIIMTGSGGVGKSALTIRCVTDNFLEEYDPTIEDSYRKMLSVDGKSVMLDILDTCGQEEFSSMQDQWTREAHYKRIPAKHDKKKHAQQKRLIDNVFADLENIFYLLSDLVYLGMNKGRYICIKLIKLLMEILFIYPLIVIVSLLMVLPSCFFLLFVRMNKIESDTKQVAVRQEIIERENCMQRFNRIINQCLRSSFMLGLLVILPIIITYVIIPNSGRGNNGIDIIVIGIYLCIILALQVCGTYRGLKSFEAKKKETVNKETGERTEFKIQTFHWNLGSMIAVVMLIWELLQMALFVYHTSNDEEEEDEVMVEEETEPLINIENERLIKINNGLKSFFEKISYISFNIASSISLADYYMIFSIIFVGLLLSFFIFRFVYELRKYAKMKRGENDIVGSREFYFYSFIGTVIYGHGTLKNVNKFSAKIISLLSDTLFLGICEKLILLLLCKKSNVDDKYYMILDPQISCWNGKHQLYATLSLILIGYYIPMCTMIAPMFDEVTAADDEEKTDQEDEEDEDEDIEQNEKTKGLCCCCKKTVNEEKENKEEEEEEEKESSKIKQLLSFDNEVDFVRPFVSTITVTKCFMLIFATYIFSGGIIGTIISEFISCFVLMVFTLYWSFGNLYLYGLTQSEPGFPFGICMIRVLGFLCGICGCFVQILKYNNIIHSNLDFLFLFIIMILSAIIIGIIFLKYYNKFNRFDDNINQYLVVTFDQYTKQLKLMDSNDNQQYID